MEIIKPDEQKEKRLKERWTEAKGPVVPHQVYQHTLCRSFRRKRERASLVAQWLGVHPPMQGSRVRALVWEDPTCHGATKPVCHNYWACALKPASHNYWAQVPQLLKHARLEPVLCNKRSHCNEKPAHHNKEQPLLTTRKPACSKEDPTQTKIN